MSKIVPLANGRGFALVDDIDYPTVIRHGWCLTTHPNPYAQARLKVEGVWKNVTMHRLIMGAVKGQKVDHKDRVGLNNVRSNLRFCTNTQNARNATGRRTRRGRPVTSKFKGVYRNSGDNGWLAQIGINHKRIYLGAHDTEESAARQYDAAAREVFGEFVYLNFPNDPPVALPPDWREGKGRAIHRKPTDAYKGVSPSKLRWKAECSYLPIRYIGLFRTKPQAALAHDIAACWTLRQKAVVNFGYLKDVYAENVPEGFSDWNMDVIRQRIRQIIEGLEEEAEALRQGIDVG